MLKMLLTTAVALYVGFIVWGKPEDRAEAAPVSTSAAVVSASDAIFDTPVILSETGQDTMVTRAAATSTVVPDAAAIAASAPVPGTVLPRVLGDPVVVNLVQGSAPGQATATTEASDGLLRVSGSTVNMRVGPSTGNAVVDSLPEGTLAEPIGPEIDGWIEIRDVASGLTGYMSARFLDPA